jgi:hypothetical protein
MIKITIDDWVWFHIQGEPLPVDPDSFVHHYDDGGVIQKFFAFLDAEKIGCLTSRCLNCDLLPVRGRFHGAFTRTDAVRVMHWLEQEGLLPAPNYHEGYKWIKVPRYRDDSSLSWEERYKLLDDHHVKETSFLIAKIRELSEKKNHEHS